MKTATSSKPTIRDIVKETGLSIGCVSNYLNGKPIKEENKVKIEEAIKKLGYVIDVYARGLAKGYTKTIGIVIPAFSNTFYGYLASEINKVLESKGYSVILNEHNTSVEKEKKIIEDMFVRRVDGIIVVPAGTQASDYVSLDSNKVVFIDKFLEGLDGFDFVILDNEEAGKTACEEFYQYGHKNVAIIYNNTNSFTGKARYKGFVEFARNHGMTVDEFGYDESIEKAYDRVKEIIESKKYTGIFSSNYISTLGSIFYINENDIKIPEDVSLIGFDNIMLTNLFKPKLTIINQPLDQIANSVVACLLHRFQYPSTKGKVTTIESQIVYGKTVKKLN